MSALYRDPHWPRASEWLAGSCLPDARAPFTVLGVPMAKGSITPGRCDLAPAAVRAALQRYSTFDQNFEQDVRQLRARDAGDLPVAELSCEDAFKPVRDAVRAISGTLVLLGGDNSITRPGVHGLGVPLERCGLLMLDAHFDLRHLDSGLNNGNPVRALLRDGLPGAHIMQIGIQPFANSADYAAVARDAGINVITADAVLDHGMEQVLHDALEYLAETVDAIYVDLDLDVMDRTFAPAAPGSRPGGLTPNHVRRAARVCGAHAKVRVMDLVEMDPQHDIAGCTALTAAACLLEFASGVLGRGSPE